MSDINSILDKYSAVMELHQKVLEDHAKEHEHTHKMFMELSELTTRLVDIISKVELRVVAIENGLRGVINAQQGREVFQNTKPDKRTSI